MNESTVQEHVSALAIVKGCMHPHIDVAGSAKGHMLNATNGHQQQSGDNGACDCAYAAVRLYLSVCQSTGCMCACVERLNSNKLVWAMT